MQPRRGIEWPTAKAMFGAHAVNATPHNSMRSDGHHYNTSRKSGNRKRSLRHTHTIFERSILMIAAAAETAIAAASMAGDGYGAAAAVLTATPVLAIVLLWIWRRRYRRVFLVGYTCYKPPDERRMGTELCEYVMRRVLPDPSLEAMQFQVNMHIKSGIGQHPYAPLSFFETNEDGSNEGLLEQAWVEMQEALRGTLDRLFMETAVEPATEVDVVIVNVCCFAPMPSLSAWVVRRYGMRQDVRTFNLSGMGCSAGIIAVSLARDVLAVRPNTRVLIASTENLTLNRYTGADRNMMLTNCLFRVGGSALLLSNRSADSPRARMELLHCVRTHLARHHDAYSSIVVREDDAGMPGCALSQGLIDASARALRENLLVLGPRVLPLSELLRYGVRAALALISKSRRTVVPDFRRAFEHWCVHPGGRAVIGGIGNSLGLSDTDMEAAFMTLHRFGNTSSSGLWYEVAYVEAKRRLRSGDRLVQIALGSGFKCATAVWRCLRPAAAEGKGIANVWDDCIDEYPCRTRNAFEDSLRGRFNLPPPRSRAVARDGKAE